MNRTRKLKATALCTAVMLAGCSSAPLPGGEGGGGYQVSIQFLDVTDLVPYSTVKVDDVTVGQVEEITVGDNWTATVTVRVNPEVELPQNSVASLRQTSLLGEKFVDLAPPTRQQPTGTLGDGDTIPLERTDRGAEVEEVLGALALVLQGGGLDQLRTINTELVDVMEGREDELSDTLGELEDFMASLDNQRQDIITALEALESLSGDLAEQRDTIGEALDALAPGVTVLAEQRGLITDAIVALGRLGDVGADVIEQSGDETIAMLRDLQPILENLVAAGDSFPQGLELGASYPFPHNVTDAVHDDFVNLHITLDLDLATILGNLTGEKPVEQADPDDPQSTPPTEQGIEPVVGGLKELLGIGLGGLGGAEEPTDETEEGE